MIKKLLAAVVAVSMQALTSFASKYLSKQDN